MAKVKALKAPRSIYCCQACGHTETKWLGRCPACQEWNSLVEELDDARAGAAERDRRRRWWRRRSRSPRSARSASAARAARAASASSIACSAVGSSRAAWCCSAAIRASASRRCSSRRSPGSSRRAAERVLYATGEESVAQTAMRARRVGAARASISRRRRDRRRADPRARARDAAGGPRGRLDPDRLHADARLDPGLARAGARVRGPAHAVREDHGHADDPRRPRHQGRRRSPAPRRSSTSSTSCSSSRATAVRTGSCARTRTGSARPRRSACSRCAAPGMAEVANPSAHLLAERPLGAPGSVVVASADGARPLLVEIQALVAPATRRASAGAPRRASTAIASSLLLAVLAQRAACDVLDRDVFVNVAGGIRLDRARDRSRHRVRDRVVGARPRDRSAHGDVRRGRPRRRDPRGHAVRAAARRGRAARVQARAACRRRTRSDSSLGGTEASGLELIAVDRLQTALGML